MRVIMDETGSLLDELLQAEPVAGWVKLGLPVMVLSLPSGDVDYANDAALALFDCDDAAGLSRIFASGTDPAIRKLSQTARRLRPGAPPQLQRVKFSKVESAPVLTLRCWREEGSSGRIIAAAADAPVSLRVPPVAKANVAQPNVAQPKPATELPARPSQTPAAIIPETGNLRFLWRTDAGGVLTLVGDSLCDVMGCEPDALVGKTFDSLIDTYGIDPAAELRAALSGRETWSRVEVNWPLLAIKKRAPVTLGGLPGFDRARTFDGFSGFGVIHLDDAVAMRAEEIDTLESIAGSSSTQNRPADSGDDPGPVAVPTENGGTSDSPSSKVYSSGGNVVPLRPPPADDRPAENRNADKDRVRMPNIADSVDLKDVPEKQSPAASADLLPVAGTPGIGQKPSDQNDYAPTGDGSGSDTKRDAGSVDEDKPASTTPAADHRTTGADTIGSPTSDRTPATPTPLHLNIPKPDISGGIELSPSERSAFREIAKALGARKETGDGVADNGLAEPSGKVEDAKKYDAGNHVPDEIAGDRANAGPKTLADVKPDPVAPLSTEPDEALTAKAPADDLPDLHNTIQPALAFSKQVPDTAGATRAPDQKERRRDSGAELLDKIDFGLLVLQGGIVAYANQYLMQMLGYRDFQEFDATNAINHVFKGRDPESLSGDTGGTIPVQTKNGDVLALVCNVKTISWRDEPASLLCLRRDEREELVGRVNSLELDVRKREAEARELEAVLDTATDGVVLLNGDGRILSLNKAGQALFGYDQNEVAGEPLSVLLSAESQNAATEYFKGISSEGLESVMNDGREMLGRARKGGALPIFMTIGRISTKPEPRFCAVLRDITQWKKAEQELKEARTAAETASSLKSDFLAKISHEVRTPLNAILGFAEVIMHERFGPVGNERYKEYLKDIHASGTHVMSLINDLLDLSKIEAGKLELDFESVDVGKVVNECVSMMQSQAIQERVVLRLSLAVRLPNVVADERSLRQIVLNLLSNSVKFNEPGGQVIVSTALTDSGHAVVRIRDTGIGMTEKDVAAALEPFRQLSTSRQSNGTGLGLPLTKALVEANRASFTIKSKKDEGTLVEVSFPPTRVLAE